MSKPAVRASRPKPHAKLVRKTNGTTAITAAPCGQRAPSRQRRGGAQSPFKSLALSRAYQLIEPGPVVLLSTIRDGRPNLMTMSWHMMVEFEPPLIACIVSTGDYSFTALSTNRECVVAIPGVALADKAVKIGNCHGDSVDKFARFGLAALPASQVSAPLVRECFANLECKVVDTSMVQSYGLFILQVVQAWAVPGYKDVKTFHHRGYGEVVFDGRRLKLSSRMR